MRRKMENKLRASFTVMNLWAQNKWQDAILYYFKLERIVTPAMEEGLRFHKEWELETNKTSKLPKVFGDKTFEKPETELHLQVSLSDWLDLSGKLDCLDAQTIYEYKTGKQESDFYSRTFQTSVYGLLATYNNRIVTRAEIYHYDQYTKKADMSIVWITDQMLRDTLSWVETIGSEMHNYFITNRLYEKYGNYRMTESGVVRFIKAGTV